MDIEDDVKIDKRSREYRNRQEQERADAIRPHHTPITPRYDAQAELARAEALAREIRDNRGPDSEEIESIFNIQPGDAPPGWTYEGKRVSVGGKSDGILGDDNMRSAHHAGWRPVPADRHPHLTPLGFTGNTIIRQGLMLMERPTTLVNEAKANDLLVARKTVKATKQRLGMPADNSLAARGDANFSAKVSGGVISVE